MWDVGIEHPLSKFFPTLGKIIGESMLVGDVESERRCQTYKSGDIKGVPVYDLHQGVV